MKLITKIMTFPYSVTVNNAISAINAIRDNENETAFRVFSGVSLIPLATSIVMFLVSLITFIVTAGYGIQVDLVKSEGLGALNSVWTSGTVGFFYNKWLCLALGIVFIAMVGIAAVDLYRSAETWKKIIFSINLALFALVSGFIAFIAVDDANFNLVRNLFGLEDSNSMTIAMMVVFGVELLLSIGLVVFLSKFGTFLSCFINTIFYFAVAPLTLLIIENLIGFVFFAITMLIIFIVGSFLLSSINVEPKSDAEFAKEQEEKQRQKTKKKIEMLEYDVAKREEAVRRHNKGEFGYQTGIDPKVCARINSQKMEEAKRLRDSLI